jgi:hypothetical protein
LDWPTWSQTAYRSWSIGEEPDELPELLVEIAFRVQNLDEAPDSNVFLNVLPAHLAVLGDEPLARGDLTIEEVLNDHPSGPQYAIEVSYEGSCQVDESLLQNPESIDGALAPLGGAVASILVQVGDLPFAFRPVDAPTD